MWHGRSRASARSITRSSKSSSIIARATSSSTKPVPPGIDRRARCGTRRRRARRCSALSRSGRSLVTTVTSALVGQRAGDGQDPMVVGLAAQRVGQAGEILVVDLDPERAALVVDRQCGGQRTVVGAQLLERAQAWRAAQPSSGWLRLASSSVITTSGSTTSCSSKRVERPRVGEQHRRVEHVDLPPPPSLPLTNETADSLTEPGVGASTEPPDSFVGDDDPFIVPECEPVVDGKFRSDVVNQDQLQRDRTVDPGDDDLLDVRRLRRSGDEHQVGRQIAADRPADGRPRRSRRRSG